MPASGYYVGFAAFMSPNFGPDKPFRPIFQKKDPENPKNPLGIPKSPPGTAKTPLGNGKSAPGIAKSESGIRKSEGGNAKSEGGIGKSEPGNAVRSMEIRVRQPENALRNPWTSDVAGISRFRSDLRVHIIACYA